MVTCWCEGAERCNAAPYPRIPGTLHEALFTNCASMMDGVEVAAWSSKDQWTAPSSVRVCNKQAAPSRNEINMSIDDLLRNARELLSLNYSHSIPDQSRQWRWPLILSEHCLLPQPIYIYSQRETVPSVNAVRLRCPSGLVVVASGMLIVVSLEMLVVILFGLLSVVSSRIMVVVSSEILADVSSRVLAVASSEILVVALFGGLFVISLGMLSVASSGVRVVVSFGTTVVASSSGLSSRSGHWSLPRLRCCLLFPLA